MIDFEIQGIKRGFSLGTYTFKLINQLTGTKTIQEVFERLKEEDQDFASSFYFCCAKHYSMSKKLPVDFEEVHVADWLDELGLERVKEITLELFNVYVSKNLKAPTTGLAPQSNSGEIWPQSN